jgi:hypothetical protein
MTSGTWHREILSIDQKLEALMRRIPHRPWRADAAAGHFRRWSRDRWRWTAPRAGPWSADASCICRPAKRRS